MSANTLPVGTLAMTAGLIVITPMVFVAARDSLTVDTAHYSEAPASLLETSASPFTAGSMLLSSRNSSSGSAAVFGISASSKEVSAIAKRVSHLRTLPNGWRGPASLAPSPTVLDWLNNHAAVLSGAEGLSLIPLEDGSVSLHWALGALDMTAEIRPDLTLYTFIDETDGDGFTEDEQPLSEEALRRFLSTADSV